MKILILGGGQVGSAIAEELAAMSGNDITIVDTDETALKNLSARLDVQTLAGNGASPAILEQAGAADTDMLLALTRSDETNLVACKLAAALFNIPQRIARVRLAAYQEYGDTPDDVPDALSGSLKAFDVTDSIHPEHLVTEHIASLTGAALCQRQSAAGGGAGKSRRLAFGQKHHADKRRTRR